VKLSIYGFDKWLPSTFETVLQYLSTHQIEASQVLKQIDLGIESYKNSINTKSFEKAQNYFQRLMIKLKYINNDKNLAILETIRDYIINTNDVQDIVNVRDLLFKSVGKTDIVIVGTIEEDKIQGIVSHYTKIVKSSDKKYLISQKYIKLNQKNTEISIPNDNSHEKQNALIFN
jgi:secreted Zn-dependent insulinase-like peptidase